MANPILRTQLEVEFTTPAGAKFYLPVNCANDDADKWPWKYLWIKTLSTSPPKTSTSIERATDASFVIEEETAAGTADSKQIALRSAFAYIATDPISVDIECDVNMEDSTAWSPTYKVEAILYDSEGSKVETFFSEDYEYQQKTISLPATVCPKILWVRASVLLVGGPLKDIPACSGKLSVNASPN